MNPIVGRAHGLHGRWTSRRGEGARLLRSTQASFSLMSLASIYNTHRSGPLFRRCFRALVLLGCRRLGLCLGFGLGPLHETVQEIRQFAFLSAGSGMVTGIVMELLSVDEGSRSDWRL